MGMQDRDWYKEHHKARQSASGGPTARPSFTSRPHVIIRSRFAPGFVCGVIFGALMAAVYFLGFA